MKSLKWMAVGLLGVFAATTFLAGCGSSAQAPSAKKEIVLKAADVQPEDYPTVMGLKKMAQLLDERTQGRIKMQVYAGGQLGGEKETMHSLATCYLLASSATIFSGIAVYAFTSINFIRTGDNRAIGYIYLGTFMLFGLVYFGHYFAQFR